MIDRQDFAQLSQPILVGPQINPFAGELGDLLTIFHDRSRALVDDRGLQLRAVGSPFALPAGRLRLTAYGGFGFHRATTRDVSGNAETLRRYHRNETTFVASAEIPLASRRNGFLPQLGELSASFEFGVVDYSDVGTFTRHNYALTWSPIERLRLQASTSSTPRPADLRVIADPVLIIPGARYFDFLTGDTVDVTQISGGNPSLAPERLHTDRLTATLSPMRSINLQLNAEYSRTRTEGFISGVPPASAAIELAFADRFARDANGRLVSVDVRPVNFDEQRQQQFRYGLSFGVPLGPPPRRAARAAASTEESATGDADPTNGDPQPPPSGPRPRLQFSVWHTILLSNRVLIRPGLAPIDLLSGGAIGISGSPPRHAVTANVTISGNGLGLSLAGAWRSESRIQTLGIGGSAPDTLRFAPIFTASLRAYANLEPLLPGAAWLKDTRLSLSVTNLTDQRQRVADLAGATPLSYQAAYRDPVGRTIGIELRKVF